MLLPLMHYLSTLVMGVLLLWGAWREHLKWTLTTVALLIVVQPFMPVVFYGSNIGSMEPFYLSINLVIGYTLLWGTWTKNLKWSLTIVGLLLILQQRTISSLFDPYIFSFAVHDLGRFVSLIAPLAIGIVLIWGAWTNHLKWSLIIVGAAISIMSLIALIPTIIA
jgi:hypothetical protein